MFGKELLHEDQREENLHFVVIGKLKVILTSTNLDDFLDEVKTLLDEYAEIIVDEFPNELPPVRSIIHHIDLIHGVNLPNKAAYRLTPQENEEIKHQVQELLEKALVKESLSPCVVPTVISPKKDGGWRMCTNSRKINKKTTR